MAAGLPGEPGADGTGAKADQAGQVVGAPALGGLHHDRGLQPQPQPQQVLVHRPHRQQRRDVGGGGIDAARGAIHQHPVGEHQDLAAAAQGRLGLVAEALQRLLQAGGALQHRQQGGEFGGGQPLLGQGLQLGFVEQGSAQVQHRGGGGIGPQRRAPPAQVHLQAHHQLLPERVNRRVGYLGEALFEIVVQQVGLVGEHRQRDVIAHAVGGLLGLPRHVLDHQLQVFGAEAVGRLQGQQVQIANAALGLPAARGQAAAVLRQPAAIGQPFGRLPLHLPVAQQQAPLQIHGQHLAGPQAPLLQDQALVQLHHAGFRAHHHIAVAGDAVAGRAQAIAVERGPHRAPIAEHQQRRPIPGFLQAGIELVEGLDLRLVIQFRLIAEGLRHQGEQAVGDRPTAAHHQLQGGIQIGRIAEGGIHQRSQIRRRLAPYRLQVGFGCLGPVDIAEQGIDFAVVTQQPHRLGQGPAGQGVGTEAPVVDREGH